MQDQLRSGRLFINDYFVGICTNFKFNTDGLIKSAKPYCIGAKNKTISNRLLLSVQSLRAKRNERNSFNCDEFFANSKHKPRQVRMRRGK